MMAIEWNNHAPPDLLEPVLLRREAREAVKWGDNQRLTQLLLARIEYLLCAGVHFCQMAIEPKQVFIIFFLGADFSVAERDSLPTRRNRDQHTIVALDDQDRINEDLRLKTIDGTAGGFEVHVKAVENCGYCAKIDVLT